MLRLSRYGQYEESKVGFIRRDEVCDGGIFYDFFLARIFVARFREAVFKETYWRIKPVMLRTSLVTF